MEPITLARLQLVHPELKRRWTSLDGQLLAGSLKIQIRMVQGLRTWHEQDTLYAEGRTIPGAPCTHSGLSRPVGTCAVHPKGLVVTNAKGGQSAHNFGYAGDADPDDPSFSTWRPDWNERDERWAELLSVAKTCGLAEGATWRSFPDTPHLYLQELPADPDDNMRSIFLEKGLEAVWEDWRTTYGLEL